MIGNQSAGLRTHFDGESLVKHIDTLFDRIFGLDRPLPILLMEISAKAIALDFPDSPLPDPRHRQNHRCRLLFQAVPYRSGKIPWRTDPVRKIKAGNSPARCDPYLRR